MRGGEIVLIAFDHKSEISNLQVSSAFVIDLLRNHKDWLSS